MTRRIVFTLLLSLLTTTLPAWAETTETEGRVERDDSEDKPLLGSLLDRGLRLSGYVQAQYESHQDSEDQLQDGKPLNLDRFLVRRARLKLEGDWKYAGAILELNGSTKSGGFAVDVRRAEASLHYRREGQSAPLVELAVGVMDIPFGYELLESSRTRPFMERGLSVRSFFPSPADVGARLGGSISWLHWTVALMNGEPQGESVGFPGHSPTQAKDLLLRVGADTGPAPLRISGNVSLLEGTGFHAGSDATKARIEWRDLNEDGVSQPYEQTAVPARAATSSKTFRRWAVGADVQLEYRSKIGATRLLGEFVLAQNLDRLMFPSDPVVTGLDARGLGWNVGLTQEIYEYFLIGVRYDSYDPDANLFDGRGGKLMPRSMRIQTVSPYAGLALPDRARLMLQYDFVNDRLARDERGIPADARNNAFTVRLQVQL